MVSQLVAGRDLMVVPTGLHVAVPQQMLAGHMAANGCVDEQNIPLAQRGSAAVGCRSRLLQHDRLLRRVKIL